MHQIELFMKYPHEVQNEWFIDLVDKGRKTAYGIHHNFHNIFNYEHFRNQIPLNDYETLKPLIERTRKGEQKLLWPTEIKWFAKSSGTTDKSKFLPISWEHLNDCHYRGGRDMVTLHCIGREDTQLFTGKNLALGGSLKNDVFGKHQSVHGDVSAIIIQNLPMWAEYFRAPNVEIALMDEWESKLLRITETMMNENVTSLAGVPSWMLVLIKQILERKGKKTLGEVWPNLEVYFHGGVSFAPYKEQFKKLLNSSEVEYTQIYNASEGFFGIQDRPGAEDMLLMLDYGIFYEFLELGETDTGKIIPLEGVKEGTDYEVIITTNAGLWRYRLGDVIQFTSINPYRFIVSGRTKQFINAFGEELMVHNTDEAIAFACSETNSTVKDYSVAPVYMSENAGRHEWLIEFDKAPSDITIFITCIDNSLKKQNSDYEAKRYNNFVLHEPAITVIPENGFYNWLKANNKLGGQFKVPRLSNNRQIVEEIKKLNEIVAI